MDVLVTAREDQHLSAINDDRASTLQNEYDRQHQLSERGYDIGETNCGEGLTADKKIPPPRSKHKKMNSKTSLKPLSSPVDYRGEKTGRINVLDPYSSSDHIIKRHSLELSQSYSVSALTVTDVKSNNATSNIKTGGSVTRAGISGAGVSGVCSTSGAVTGSDARTNLGELSPNKRQFSMPLLPTSSTLWRSASSTTTTSSDAMTKRLRDVNFNRLPEVCKPVEQSAPPELPSSEPPDTSVRRTNSTSSYLTPLYSSSSAKIRDTAVKTSNSIRRELSDKSSASELNSLFMETCSHQKSSDDRKTNEVTNSCHNFNANPIVSPIVVRRKLSRLYAKDDDECVGFASLPEQVHRKAVKRGFDFTLMVVGETGLGKSTLITSLFLNPELYKERKLPDAADRIQRTVQIEKKYMEIEEKGVKLRLTIIDTPGFSDSVDAEQSSQPVEKYINQQFEQYFKDESGLNRKNIKDYRVHCCLYFISPYGHGLRQTDIKFIKHVQDKVNIVPIIGKADALTPSEVTQLKEKILDQIEEHNLQIYEFPDCDSDEDEDFKKQDAELKAAIPFAVIGSNTVVEVNGRKVRGRLYPWGVVEVDNPQHCDFSKLRMMLISTHMQDLKDVTRDVHYENFRAKQIKEQMTRSQRERNSQPEDFYKTNMEKRSTDSKLKRDSSPNFESIMDQSQLLEQKEEEIRRMQEMIVKMQAQLQNSKRTNVAIPNGDKKL